MKNNDVVLVTMSGIYEGVGAESRKGDSNETIVYQ